MVRTQLRAQATRSYGIALSATFGVAVMTTADWVALVAVLPSLMLSSGVLLHGWGRQPNPRLLALGILVGLITLVWAAVTEANLVGSVGLSICLALQIGRFTSKHARYGFLACAGIAAISSIAILLGSPTGLRTALLLTLPAVIWMVTILDMEVHTRLLAVFERAKDAELENSILRERARFAADLHDIQGHSLHVIKLKAAVAQRMQSRAPQRTAAELTAIQELTARTIAQARELAEASHRIRFSAELENTRELLDAAGIAVVSNEAQPPSDDAESSLPLALVLREATTNILRHSNARNVRLEIQEEEISVSNDGAPDAADSRAPHRGLATLRRRVSEAGGALDVVHSETTFTLRARVSQELSA